MTHQYQGSCHCGAIKFSYEGEEITQALRCTCSICRRKGALMSTEAIPVSCARVRQLDASRRPNAAAAAAVSPSHEPRADRNCLIKQQV